MKPLQRAMAAGIGVLIVQHERKGGGELVESGRGSTAFAGAVDILISLSRRRGKGPKTWRELHTECRFEETPASLLIQLTTEGYVSHGPVRAIANEEARESILDILPDSERNAMTIAQLTKECAVSRTTAQKVIESLLKEELLLRTGKGTKTWPYRYSMIPLSKEEGDRKKRELTHV